MNRFPPISLSPRRVVVGTLGHKGEFQAGMNLRATNKITISCWPDEKLILTRTFRTVRAGYTSLTELSRAKEYFIPDLSLSLPLSLFTGGNYEGRPDISLIRRLRYRLALEESSNVTYILGRYHFEPRLLRDPAGQYLANNHRARR